MSCRTGCPTQDHENWGDCVRASNLSLNAGDAKSGFIDNGYTQRKWDAELKAYKDARANGIQPKSTRMKDIQDAVKLSDKAGKPVDTSKPNGGLPL
jgi:hypothetical protein